MLEAAYWYFQELGMVKEEQRKDRENWYWLGDDKTSAEVRGYTNVSTTDRWAGTDPSVVAFVVLVNGSKWDVPLSLDVWGTTSDAEPLLALLLQHLMPFLNSIPKSDWVGPSSSPFHTKYVSWLWNGNPDHAQQLMEEVIEPMSKIIESEWTNFPGNTLSEPGFFRKVA